MLNVKACDSQRSIRTRSTILAGVPLQALMHKGLRGIRQLAPVTARSVKGFEQGELAMQ